MRELHDPDQLAAALRDARDYTLAIYAHLDEAALRFPYLRTVNPPLWELAHLAWFQEHWCLRWQDGAPRRDSLLPDADRMLNSALIAHAERWALPQLTWPVVRGYLATVLDTTLERLARDAQADPYFPLLALLHEDMHAEAFLMSLQTLGMPAPMPARASIGPNPGCPHTAGNWAATPCGTPLAAREVVFEGGRFEMGSGCRPDFVFDNERCAHAVVVEPFALATTTVTQAQYRAFVEAGGYGERRWWSQAGWAWRESAGALQPRHWQRDGSGWRVRRFDRLQPLQEDAPMIHVNAYEAEAYAAFAGARLPTEAEWEFAARAALDVAGDRYPWGAAPPRGDAVNMDYRYGRAVAVDSLAQGDSRSGLRQLLGNIWEWTASPFLPYPGFEPGPYREYSQPWFGDHRVLRGGSFATRSRLVHNRWRNFYTPDRNDVFAGIRLARSLRD
ncbi:MAG: selenoneine synthase SenA [Burkholderiales bacterium]